MLNFMYKKSKEENDTRILEQGFRAIITDTNSIDNHEQISNEFLNLLTR